MSKQLIDFKEDHQVLLKNFLRFFDKKKEECLKQVEIVMEDCQSDVSDQKLFTKMDFDELMEKVSLEIKDVMKQELQMFYRMSGVMVQMLMLSAEQQSFTLKAQVNHMENYKALEEMKDFDELKNQIDGLQGTLMNRGLQSSGLPSLENAMMQK